MNFQFASLFLKTKSKDKNPFLVLAYKHTTNTMIEIKPKQKLKEHFRQYSGKQAARQRQRRPDPCDKAPVSFLQE
jgi:hypothetical protein